MAKQQVGQLIWVNGAGWAGRFYATVEGERVRVYRVLCTKNKPVARRKLAKLIAEGNVSQAEARRPETFEEAARRILDEQKASGLKTWKARRQRYESYVFPSLGSCAPADVRAADVRAVLEAVRDAGKARQMMIHVKNDISAVLGTLWRAEQLAENVCARVLVPQALQRATERTKKERAVLTDNELVQYLGWQHPDERFQGATLERQTMACVARMFGGLRTSDLHAIKWEQFDTNAFEWGYAPRKKGSTLARGGKPQLLTIPEMLRPILRDWWERGGRKAAGLIFPKRRGEGVGVEGRLGSSHARALRTDMRRVLGIDKAVTRTIVRKFPNGSERTDTRVTWKVSARPLTARETTLFTETEFTLPVDFHSWRRSYNQALADAGVNAQQAKALAGHSTLAAHERYLQNSEKARTIPAAALPNAGIFVIGQRPLGSREASPRKMADPGGDADPRRGMIHAGWLLRPDFISALSAVQVRPSALRKTRTKIVKVGRVLVHVRRAAQATTASLLVQCVRARPSRWARPSGCDSVRINRCVLLCPSATLPGVRLVTLAIGRPLGRR
jgi:integrase